MSGYVVAGILPDVSRSLHMSAGTAGQLMTVYALSYALVAILVWGVCGWGLVAPQQHRLIEILPASAPLLIALNSSVLYAGVALAGVVGAVGIHAVGLYLLGPIGGALVIGGLVAAELARAAIDRRKRALAGVAQSDDEQSASAERAA